MKKVISLIIALVLCFSMACAVVADDFAPSISYEDFEFVVPSEQEAVAIIRDANGNVVEFILDDCLIVVTVAQALDKNSKIPEHMREELLDVYNKLNNGDMKLPYDKLDTKYKAKDFEIRELIAAELCDEHTKMLAEDGVTVEITFYLGVQKTDKVYVMTYIEEEWDNVVKVVNNGDGTVTVTFEELCPIAFSVVDKPLTPFNLLQRMLNYFKAHIQRLIK